MREIVMLFGAWLACSFIVGVFVGRFIRVGQTDRRAS